MADSFSKKENNKKKIQKQQEKAKRREERKTTNNKGKSLDDMIAYVDVNGQLTSTPPDNDTPLEINLDDIQLGAAPIQEEDPLKTGIVTFLSEKGYGFITEDKSKENLFFHNNNCIHQVKKGNKVSFEKEKTAKGFAAVNIQLVK
ncbi:cold shock domain-containing protein [Elizabethkingia meningoseptica]|uniref:Cold-shock protein n=1 Tax=Elizabethkingia meningoseptica TaxID=238 RepID=A0A1V3TY95_ELIME|nr:MULTISPECIES: cold shock domain-containing protein [Elizabethkingia]AQX06771.1 cold-shock protein [Elizabethkingia meningoseptica]AQX11025.1 cold-shock protein [Elizabethkingia meningoseptica]AQX48818.1 cold-shock protein [Elizabethkingia meningoseptica]EJK5329990.1 cold shock domain-containing protein [Elizabethkingia meningoseptica]EOR29893.1 Cold-shock protein [Elizabethkingia meningoseptica ATCC 13253 = NBRC 12535]